MPRFIFQLEGVLKHRRSIERQKQRQLALIQIQMQQLRDELKNLDFRVQETNADLRNNRLIGPLDMAFLAAHRRFVASMHAKAISLVQKMALVQRQIEEAQKALAEAAKARKVIEKLREKQFQRWLAEQHRRESFEMDEIGTQLAYRHLEAAREAVDRSGDEA